MAHTPSGRESVTSDLQQLDRLSIITSTTSKPLESCAMDKSPGFDYEVGANKHSICSLNTDDEPLREGEVANLFSRNYCGLLAQYFAIGVVYGTLPRTVYPYLNNYLHMDGYQTLSARVLLSLPWSCKLFFGILSDAVPCWGYRRRPYMVIGWLVCALVLFVMASRRIPLPYYMDPTLRGKDLSKYPVDQLQGRINFDAPNAGAPMIILMMCASFGYMLADVAADGYMVELAQRERRSIRGSTQATVYLARSAAMILATFLVGFGLNSTEYGGTFSWNLGISSVLFVCGFASLLAIPCVVFFIRETPVTNPLKFRDYIGTLWHLLQNCAMLQILCYRFFSGIFDGFTVTAADPIQRYWVHVDPMNDALFSVFGTAVFTLTIWLTKRYGLNWDWRVVIAITLCSVVMLDSLTSFLTIWDVVRNQWFYLGAPILEDLPVAVNFLVSTFVVVEMADTGVEGAVYAMLTTVANLANPFASCLSKNVNSLFDVNVEAIIKDTHHVRMQVTYTYVICYVMKLLSLAWLVLLPRQKRETQLLKKRSRKSRTGGVVALIVFFFALIWSISTNVLSIYPSTACLRLAGGKGCN